MYIGLFKKDVNEVRPEAKMSIWYKSSFLYCPPFETVK